MSFEPLEPIHLPPLEVGPDTFLLRSAQPAFGAPLTVSMNSLVIRGVEPIVVDTNTRANRDAWLEDLESVVDPGDVRWVFLSHDDDDHTGNLEQVLLRCPGATLVTSWAGTERMGCSFWAPPERVRWVDDGGTIDLPDRTLRVIRPPVYDSPTTRALFDESSGVLWAVDAFATPMPAEPVDTVADLPPELWTEGLAMFHHHALCPWLGLVDHDRYQRRVDAIRAVEPSVVVGAHTPVITGDSIAEAFDLLAALPGIAPPPHPDQRVLEVALAGGAAAT
jgi:flavorubredoxin